MTGLTNAQVHEYQENGVLFPLKVLDETERTSVLDAIARIDQQPEHLRRGYLIHRSHVISKTLADVCRNPKILDKVESVLGPNIYVWASNFFLKEPKSPAYVGWHQDAAYWGLEPADIVTAWVAIMPSTVEAGCMRVVPGTHKGEIVSHTETYAADNILSRGQEIPVEVDPSAIVDVVLAPGEMSLHHVKIAHNSEPNRSNHRRIGFAVRYVAAHVRQMSGKKDQAMLVRGTDKWGYFEPEEGAKGEFLPEDLARHAGTWEGSLLAKKPIAKAS